MNTNQDKSRLLRLALRANAAFSTICGIAFLAAPDRIAAYIGHGYPADLTSTGASLLVFAGWLGWMSTRPQVSRAGTWLAIGMDCAWVVMTAMALSSGAFNEAGRVAAIIVALCVADFAIFQYVGLRKAAAA